MGGACRSCGHLVACIRCGVGAGPGKEKGEARPPLVQMLPEPAMMMRAVKARLPTVEVRRVMMVIVLFPGGMLTKPSSPSFPSARSSCRGPFAAACAHASDTPRCQSSFRMECALLLRTVFMMLQKDHSPAWRSSLHPPSPAGARHSQRCPFRCWLPPLAGFRMRRVQDVARSCSVAHCAMP